MAMDSTDRYLVNIAISRKTTVEMDSTTIANNTALPELYILGNPLFSPYIRNPRRLWSVFLFP